VGSPDWLLQPLPPLGDAIKSEQVRMTAAIFYAKTKMGWKETVVNEPANKDDKVTIWSLIGNWLSSFATVLGVTMPAVPVRSAPVQLMACSTRTSASTIPTDCESRTPLYSRAFPASSSRAPYTRSGRKAADVILAD
jgi:hypothetical protein